MCPELRCVQNMAQTFWNINVATAVQWLSFSVLEQHIFVMLVMMIFKEWLAFLRKNYHTVLQVPKANSWKELNVHSMLFIHPPGKSLHWVVECAEMLTLFRTLRFLCLRREKLPSSSKRMWWSLNSAQDKDGTIFTSMKMNHSQCKKDAKYHVHNSCYGKFPHYFGLSSFEPRHQTCEVFACGHYRHWPVKHWTFIDNWYKRIAIPMD